MLKFLHLVIICWVLSANTVLVFAESQNDQALDITRQHWSHYVNEPIKHFKAAYQYFKEGDFESTVYELRQSIAYLVLESQRETPNKGLIIEILDILQDITGKLETGTSVSRNEYDETFTHVNFVLYTYYQDQGLKSWENERPVRAGRALNASVQHLERAAELSEYEFNAEEKNTIKESKDLFQQMINNPKKTEKMSVNKQVKALGGVMKNFKINTDSDLKFERNF